MCRFCAEGRPAIYHGPAGEASGASQSGKPEAGAMPSWSGEDGRKLLIKGGHVLSMDPKVGDFAGGDVLISGKKIEAVGKDLKAGDAAVVDAAGMIVIPGFIDTHHHQFETALRGVLGGCILIKDGQPHSADNY